VGAAPEVQAHAPRLLGHEHRWLPGHPCRLQARREGLAEAGPLFGGPGLSQARKGGPGESGMRASKHEEEGSVLGLG